jgi:hypothetical protein
MSLYKFKASKQKREEGILVEIDTSGAKPKAYVVKEVGSNPTFVSGYANEIVPRYARANESAMQPYREAQTKGGMTQAEDTMLLNASVTVALVEGALLGWHNITDESGQPLPFSREAAKKLLTDLPLVETQLWLQVTDEQNFRIDLPKAIETDAKNS